MGDPHDHAHESGLSEQDLRQLPDGTRIVVTWDGGNGPHEYVLRFDAWGAPYAETNFAHGNCRARLDDASIAHAARAPHCDCDATEMRDRARVAQGEP